MVVDVTMSYIILHLLKYGNVLRPPFELVTETDLLFTSGLATLFLKIDVTPLFDFLIKTQGYATDSLNPMSSSPFLSMPCQLT